MFSTNLTQDWKCHHLHATPLDQKGFLVFKSLHRNADSVGGVSTVSPALVVLTPVLSGGTLSC